MRLPFILANAVVLAVVGAVAALAGNSVEQVGGVLLVVVSLGLLVYHDVFARFVGQWGLMAQ